MSISDSDNEDLDQSKLKNVKLIPDKAKSEAQIMDLATKWYKEMRGSSKRLKMENLYSTELDHSIISPNRLHTRFRPNFRLIPTSLQKKLSDKIDNEIAEGYTQIYIKGPIGIGKSHALLAKALELRTKPKNIVIYINNPIDWINAKFTYITRELIYAMMPFRKDFSHDPVGLDDVLPQVLPTKDSLFKWLYLLTYHATFPGIIERKDPFERVLEKLEQEIRSFAERTELNVFCISDQENLYRDPKKLAFQREDQFPFNLRYRLGKYQIMTASSNNDTTELQTRWRSVEFYERFSSTEIKEVVEKSLKIYLIPTDHLLLYEACKGNPLEASTILEKYKNSERSFRAVLSEYFTNSCKHITDANELFLNEKRLEDKSKNKTSQIDDDFQYVLLHLDAETNVDEAGVGPAILNAMNKQYMFIDSEKRTLQSLFPAAEYALSQLRKIDFVEKDVKKILTNPEYYTNDTVGRLLELYIKIQLQKPKNCGKEFQIKYFDDRKFQGMFIFNYEKIVKIRLGEIVPERIVGNVLCIPENRNYPCVDWLFYDQDKHLLYPMQLSVSLEKHKDSHARFKAEFLSQWRDKLDKLRADGKKLRMQWIWIGGPWNAQTLSLKANPLPIQSQTPGSWTIDYKQLPYALFELAVNCPQKIPIPQLLQKVFQVEGFKRFHLVSEKTAQQTFKAIFQKGFPEQLQNLKGTIEIDYFKQETHNIKGDTAIFHFSDQKDVSDFQSFFPCHEVKPEDYINAKKDPNSTKNSLSIKFP